MFTVTGTSTARLNLILQVTVTLEPTGRTGLYGSLIIMTEVRIGTNGLNVILKSFRYNYLEFLTWNVQIFDNIAVNLRVYRNLTSVSTSIRESEGSEMKSI